jgi:hypothetical protein
MTSFFFFITRTCIIYLLYELFFIDRAKTYLHTVRKFIPKVSEQNAGAHGISSPSPNTN